MTTEAENNRVADELEDSEPQVQAAETQEDSPEERVSAIASSLVSDVQELLQSVRESSQAEKEAGLEQARKEALETAAQAFADTASRIRSEESVTGIATALVEGASRFCGRAALFIHRGDQLLGFRVAGEPTAETQLEFQRLSIGVTDASGAADAIRSLAPVVVDAEPEALSQPVVELFALSPDRRVHLVPVSLRDKVLAVIYCDDQGESGERPVLIPAIKALISLAEAWIEAVGTRRKQAAA